MQMSNPDTSILDLYGRPVMAEGKPLTVREACITAILNMDANHASGEERYKRWSLAKKLQSAPADDLDLEVEEIVMVKDAVGKVYMPVLVGPIWDFLEGR